MYWRGTLGTSHVHSHVHGASKFSPDVNTVRARGARGTLHPSSLAASRAGGAARVGRKFELFCKAVVVPTEPGDT